MNEYESLQAVQSNEVRLGVRRGVSEATFGATDHATRRRVLATYGQSVLSGTAAVTRHSYKGDVTYIGVFGRRCDATGT